MNKTWQPWTLTSNIVGKTVWSKNPTDPGSWIISSNTRLGVTIGAGDQPRSHQDMLDKFVLADNVPCGELR